jgi:hypothetical protein
MLETVMDHIDLTPIDSECLRCHTTEPMHVPGLCAGCRDELGVKFAADVKNIEVARYEPTMHVTPNAVALKDD